MKVKSTQQVMLEIAPYTVINSITNIAMDTGLAPQTMRNWRNGFSDSSMQKMLLAVDAAGYELQLVKKS